MIGGWASHFAMKTAIIRARMFLMSRKAASALARREADRTLEIVESHDAVSPRKVSRMLGVDPEMQGWSLLEILEHNAIVNERLTDVVATLARGREVVTHFDIKTDVLPGSPEGVDQVERFRRSVDEHIRIVDGLLRLRGTVQFRHPIFGLLDAHGVHALFGLHLMLHRRQAEKAVS